MAADDLIAEVLLGAEGAKLGVKAPATAAPAIDLARRNAAVERYLQVVVYPGVQVPEADLRERFHQRGDQVRLLLVARPDEAQARATLARIAAGASFADEAATSVDPTSKAKKGDLGWLPRSALSAALAKEAFVAPIGKVQGPVLAEGAWSVYLVQDRRLPDEAAYALVKDRLRADLEPQARSAAAEKHRAKLVADLKGRVDQKASPPPVTGSRPRPSSPPRWWPAPAASPSPTARCSRSWGAATAAPEDPVAPRPR